MQIIPNHLNRINRRLVRPCIRSHSQGVIASCSCSASDPVLDCLGLEVFRDRLSTGQGSSRYVIHNGRLYRIPVATWLVHSQVSMRKVCEHLFLPNGAWKFGHYLYASAFHISQRPASDRLNRIGSTSALLKLGFSTINIGRMTL